MTAEVREKYLLLLTVGMSRTRARQALSLSERTVRRLRHADRTFAEAEESASASGEGKLLSRIFASASTVWVAAAWLLERLHPSRYAQGRRGTWDESDIANVVAQLVSLFSVHIPSDKRPEVMSQVQQLLAEARRRNAD
jgi:hypothetical protein